MPLKWTEEEIERLRDMYPDCDTEDVAIVLGRTTDAVTQKAFCLGIKKSAAWMEQQRKRFAEGGKKSRYQKGHVPWNTCTVGIAGKHPNSRKTQFKKGHVPKNTLRDGAITVRNDNRGVPQKFIRVGLGKWAYLSRYNYEKFIGPTPKGHVIRFRDGDTMNCEPENLVCISQKLNMLLNSKHGYTREQAEVLEACGFIKDYINNKNCNNGEENINGGPSGSPVRDA